MERTYQQKNMFFQIRKGISKNMVNVIQYPRLLRYGVIAMALSLICLFTFTSTASAHESTPQTQPSPVGTWNLTIYLVQGPKQGLTITQTITFNADGTLKEVLNGVTGTGTWQLIDKYTFDYVFDEPIYDTTGTETSYIHVTQNAVLFSNDSYTAIGQGTTFTLPDGTPITNTTNKSVTLATRS